MQTDDRVWLTSVPENAERWRKEGRTVSLLTQDEARAWWRAFRAEVQKEFN